jgi:hypothetical protein
MARRRFEMHHYRQALLRMRQGDSDRDIAAARVMGRPKAAQWRRIAASAAGWMPRGRCPTTRLSPPHWAAPQGQHHHLHAGAAPRAAERLGRAGRLGHRHPRRAEAPARLDRQLLGRAPPAGRHAQPAPARDHLPAGLRPGDAAQVDFGAGPTLHAPRRPAPAHLGLRDDAVPQPPPVRRVRLGPDGGHLAGLPPPRLRVVRRRAPSA